eukprot:365851_1
MNATFNESEGASNQPNVPVLEPMNPSVIEMNHNKNNAMGPYAPNAYTATNTTAQEDSLSITCRKKDFRKCTTIVQWILIYYSVAAVSYLLISNSNQPICSCSDINIQQMLQMANTSTIAPTTTSSPTASTKSTTSTATASSTTTTTASPTTTSTTSTSVTPCTSSTATTTVTAGIIQVQGTISHTKVTVSSSGWIEPSEDYRVSITPKYADSDIHISYHFGWNGYGIGVNTLITWTAAKLVSSSMIMGNITSSGIDSVRNAISGVVQRRNNGYDWNDQTFAYWTTIDSPASTERITYGLMMGMETGGSGDVRIGESFGSFADYDPRWPWSMPVVITAMEIRNGD